MRSPVTVIEVGPAAVHGADGAVAAREALTFLDDELMLVDDHAVPVAEVWSTLLRSAIGDAAAPVVVVHPTAWSPRRVDTVVAAARRWRPEVVTLTRAEVLGDTAATVVEIDDDLVVVAAGEVSAVARSDHCVVEIVRRVGGQGPVVVDAPDGVAHAVPLARAIVAALHADGVAATVVGAHAVRRAVIDRQDARAEAPRRRPRRACRGRSAAVLVGAALTIGTVGAAGVVGDRPPPVDPMTLVVEGRIGVLVPVSWTVRRVTGGPGSRRLQIVSPADESVALHVTQSVLPQAQSLEQMAATLQGALAAEPAEVFTDFRADDRRSGRQVVSYRERRAADEIAWFVFADKAVRIAIGCRSPRGSADLVDDACDAAVRSAHAVF